MIDKHPAVIARCRDTADVVTCVRFAREHGTEVAVRGGGHNAAGLGVGDGALVIDMSLMRSTTVDPDDHTVRADTGSTWSDVDHADRRVRHRPPRPASSPPPASPGSPWRWHRLSVPHFGLTVDDLLAADIVLADGTFVTASDDLAQRPFWALRGRGGNFGSRHLVHVPLPRHRRAPHGHRRLRFLRPRRHGRGDALVPGAGPVAAGGAQRLDHAAPVPPWRRSRRPCGSRRPSASSGVTGPHDRADPVLEPFGVTGRRSWWGFSRCRSPCCGSSFDAPYPAHLQWSWRADFFR